MKVSNKKEIFGWLGSFFLTVCAIPEVIISIQIGICQLSYSFLILWGIGEVFACIYIILKSQKVSLLPLIFNGLFNILIVTTLLYFK